MPSLEAAEERWRLTIDNAPVGIALVALDGTWLRVNTALCEMLGYADATLRRLTFQDITHPDDLSADLELLEQLVAGDIPKYRMRKRYWHADGHEVPVDLSVSLVRTPAGEPMHFVSHIADLSDEMHAATRIEEMNAALVEQAAALESTNADLQAFAMLVSHDLQAPLSTVAGYLQLLQDEQMVQDEDGVDWLRRASAATQRMSDLVQSLLTMSLSDSVLVRVPVSISRLVDEVLADLDAQVVELGAAIETDARELVKGDPTRLRQVLQNLVQNALRYRDPDRPVQVCVTLISNDAEWTVTVDDNAQGVPPDRREAIFDLFTRLSPAEDDGGHGIGLAACRRIVQRHGGRIWVEDNPTGIGSRFVFTLAK